MPAPPYDPENIEADGLYAQIREVGVELASIRAKRKSLQTQLRTLVEQEKAKIAELVSLRRSITVSLVGRDVDPTNPDPPVDDLPPIPPVLEVP